MVGGGDPGAGGVGIVGGKFTVSASGAMTKYDMMPPTTISLGGWFVDTTFAVADATPEPLVT